MELLTRMINNNSGDNFVCNKYNAFKECYSGLNTKI